MSAMPVILWGAVTTSPADLWSILLCVAVGGAAIYLLLPRPQPFPTWMGAGLGTLALVGAALLLVRTSLFSIEGVLFYAFSAIALVSGTFLVSLHNPARAALSFTLVVLSTCGLFLLLAAPFLTAATIIIYAGAIVVTFLFVLMLAQQEGLSDADLRSREPLFSALAGFALLAALLYVLQLTFRIPRPQEQLLEQLQAKTSKALTLEKPDEIVDVVGKDQELFKEFSDLFLLLRLEYLSGNVESEIREMWTAYARAGDLEEMKKLLRRLQTLGNQAQADVGLVYPHGDRPETRSPFSGPPSVTPPQELRRNPSGVPHLPAENSSYLGRSLFTDYLLAVEIGGFLLLVAIVGAIAIAQRSGKQERSA